MEAALQALIEFREKLYSSFLNRPDALMELVDAIASNTTATSPVALSLNPCFHRQYGSLLDAIANFLVPKQSDTAEAERNDQQLNRMRIVAQNIPQPISRNFTLFGIDTTAAPRPFAKTLMDRGVHYSPNPILDNKPITIGHSFSILAALPEKTQQNSPPWIIPLLIQRVPTKQKATVIGAEQVTSILNDTSLPFNNGLSALAGDTAYCVPEFLHKTTENKNLVTIVRSRGNRKYYQSPICCPYPRLKGHPQWYGASFNMKIPSTWSESDATEVVPFTFKNGRECLITIEAWYNMLMKGTFDIPMHEHPFTLMRITAKDVEGKMVFKKPLWLIAIGERRLEIPLCDILHAYRQRYDMEHFFRFGKQKLLMNSFQTPDVGHEESWWEIVGLAYIQLYLAASLVENHPHPWERYLPEFQKKQSGTLASPSMVQRLLSVIIQTIGTPASLPKPRGKSPGRQKGQSPGKRDRCPVIMKGTPKAGKAIRAP